LFVCAGYKEDQGKEHQQHIKAKHAPIHLLYWTAPQWQHQHNKDSQGHLEDLEI
jgi:hypothetical protein